MLNKYNELKRGNNAPFLSACLALPAGPHEAFPESKEGEHACVWGCGCSDRADVPRFSACQPAEGNPQPRWHGALASVPWGLHAQLVFKGGEQIGCHMVAAMLPGVVFCIGCGRLAKGRGDLFEHLLSVSG